MLQRALVHEWVLDFLWLRYHRSSCYGTSNTNVGHADMILDTGKRIEGLRICCAECGSMCPKELSPTHSHYSLPSFWGSAIYSTATFFTVSLHVTHPSSFTYISRINACFSFIVVVEHLLPVTQQNTDLSKCKIHMVVFNQSWKDITCWAVKNHPTLELQYLSQG